MSEKPLSKEDYAALYKYLADPQRSANNKQAHEHMLDGVTDALKRLGLWERAVKLLNRRGER